MKFFSTVIVSFCVIGLLIGVTPIKADAGGKKSIMRGDFCWEFIWDNPDDGEMTLQLGVTHIGGGHHLCSGSFNITKAPAGLPDLVDRQFTTYGNMEIVDGETVLTLSIAGVRIEGGIENIGIDMMKAILDPDYLNGTFEWIGVYEVDVELSDGTLTSTTCQ